MTLVSNGVATHRYDERVHEGMRLGRHLELDARSLRYMVQEAVTIQPHEWLPTIPTIDQGNLGSCTGNAGTYALSALYGADLSAAKLGSLTLNPNDALQDEAFAVELYHEATVKDGFPGDYPPDDTGSSGLGVCRALKAAGLIKRYMWATTARAFASLLQRGGVIIGMPWYEAFFTPDPGGFIDHEGWQSTQIAGGHEVYVEALEAWSDSDPNQSIVRVHNSWGTGWGDGGRFRMRLSTYVALKQQIDVKQFVR